MTATIYTTLSTSTPTMLSPYGTHSGLDFTIQNVNDSGYIYLGTAEVSSTNYGFRILPNHSISFELNGRDDIYAIASTADMKVAVISVALETGS